MRFARELRTRLLTPTPVGECRRSVVEALCRPQFQLSAVTLAIALTACGDDASKENTKKAAKATSSAEQVVNTEQAASEEQALSEAEKARLPEFKLSEEVTRSLSREWQKLKYENHYFK